MATYSKSRKRCGKYYGSDRASAGDYEPGTWRLSESKKRAIKRAYSANEMTTGEIATMFGVAGRTILRIAKAEGAKMRAPKSRSKEELDELFRMWNDPTIPARRVALAAGVCRPEVLRRLFVSRGYNPIDRRKITKAPNPTYVFYRPGRAKQ